MFPRCRLLELPSFRALESSQRARSSEESRLKPSRMIQSFRADPVEEFRTGGCLERPPAKGYLLLRCLWSKASRNAHSGEVRLWNNSERDRLSGTLLVRDSQQTGHCHSWARPGPRREGPLPGPGGEICWSERDQVKVKPSPVLWQERGLCWRHSAPFVAVGKGGFCWRPGLASGSLIGASFPHVSSVQGSS